MINRDMSSSLTLFLGGTVGKSTWRDTLIPLLEQAKLKYFNPVVEDWDSSARIKENIIKSSLETVELYVITSEMRGVYSIAEAVDASNKKPDKTIFMIKRDGFNSNQLYSLDATLSIIQNNGAYISESIFDIVRIFKSIELAHRVPRVSILARKNKLL